MTNNKVGIHLEIVEHIERTGKPLLPSKEEITMKENKKDIMDSWINAQAKTRVPFRPLRLIIILIALVFYAVTVQWAHGATIYMEFVVQEVQAERVLVENSDGDNFWFTKPGFKVHKGLRVVVRSDLEYMGDEQWVWDIDETEIIGREK